MADMITRCPQCGTAFRITTVHLKSAKGAVRCGSCLQVFNARENLTPESQALFAATKDRTDPEPSPAPQDRTAVTSTPPAEDRGTDERSEQATPAKAPESTRPDAPGPAETEQHEPFENDLDNVLISDDMGHIFDEDDVFAAEGEEDVYAQPQSVTQASLFERFSSDDEDEGDEETGDDESWALKLLDDEDSTSADQQSEWIRPSVHYGPDTLDEDDLPEQDPWDEAMVRADDDEQGSTWYERASAMASGIEQPEDEDAVSAGPLTASRQDSSGSAYLDAIEPEPVEFSYREKRPFWHNRILWGSLAVFAALVLLVQVAWMQYPSLNRTEPYRSFYAQACNVLGCQLPPQVDRAAIRTSNLVVRSHPRRDNALMVDVVLQNTAPFSQSFPVLELTFSDLQSNIVAQRRFAPDEYLGGELTGRDAMPVRQPVHIAMEIIDPGPDAVNYRVEIIEDGR